MYYLLPLTNQMLAIASLALLVVTIALYYDFFINKGTFFAEKVNRFAWYAVMTVTIGSVIMSLVYSEYFGFIPCSLCWLQRIAIYPQALLSVLAFRAKDTKHFPVYGIGLSLFGFAVAVYQYVYQMIPAEVRESGITPCLADGSNADCAVKVINEFGFVTFPFVSAVSFAFLIILFLYMRRAQKQYTIAGIVRSTTSKLFS